MMIDVKVCLDFFENKENFKMYLVKFSIHSSFGILSSFDCIYSMLSLTRFNAILKIF